MGRSSGTSEDQSSAAGPAVSAAAAVRGAGAALKWLWDWKPDELVPPGRQYNGNRDQSRKPAAWEELATSLGQPCLGSLSRTAAPSAARPSRPPSRAAASIPSRATTVTPSCGHRSSSPMSSAAPDSSSSVKTRTFCSSLWRKASRQTVAQFEVSGPDVILRGLGLNDALEERQQKAAELAAHKMDSHKEYADVNRLKASRWFMQRQRAKLKQLHVAKDLDDFEAGLQEYLPVACESAAADRVDFYNELSPSPARRKTKMTALEDESRLQAELDLPPLQEEIQSPGRVTKVRFDIIRADIIEAAMLDCEMVLPREPATPCRKGQSQIFFPTITAIASEDPSSKTWRSVADNGHKPPDACDEFSSSASSNDSGHDAIDQADSEQGRKLHRIPSDGWSYTSDEGPSQSTDLPPPQVNTGEEQDGDIVQSEASRSSQITIQDVDKEHPETMSASDSIRKGSAASNSLREMQQKRLLNYRGDSELPGKRNSFPAQAQGQRPSAQKASGKMRKLLAARRKDFDRRPFAERERLRQAFQAGDRNCEAHLDRVGLRAALEHLCLSGRTKPERKAVSMLIKENIVVSGIANFFDFVFDLVPKVDLRLSELRSPRLFAEFKTLDTAKVGCLKAPCVLRSLELHAYEGARLWDDQLMKKFWASYSEEFPALFKNEENEAMRTTVNFAGFNALRTGMMEKRTEFQRKVERETTLLAALPSSIEKAHFGELSMLLRLFVGKDFNKREEDGEVWGSEIGSYPVPHILLALVNSGVVASVGDSFRRTRHELAKYDETTLIPFVEFLKLVGRLRDEQRVWVTHGISNYVRLARGTIQLEDVDFQTRDIPEMIQELNLGCDCQQHFDDISEISELMVADHDERILLSSLVEYVLKIAQKLRQTTRQHENSLAESLGITEEGLVQLRMCFADLTSTGSVGLREIKSLLHYLNCRARFNDADIESAIDEITETNILLKDHSEELPTRKKSEQSSDRNRDRKKRAVHRPKDHSEELPTERGTIRDDVVQKRSQSQLSVQSDDSTPESSNRKRHTAVGFTGQLGVFEPRRVAESEPGEESLGTPSLPGVMSEDASGDQAASKFQGDSPLAADQDVGGAVSKVTRMAGDAKSSDDGDGEDNVAPTRSDLSGNTLRFDGFLRLAHLIISDSGCRSLL